MANIDEDYLFALVSRFKGYKSPNETQKLIIALGREFERSDEDNKKLAVLLKAEKKADELTKARAATQRILNAEKAALKKHETRKKIIWGSALKKASENSPEMAQVILKLYNDGYIAERDKEAVKADYDDLNRVSFD
ncbi:hypothetical protein R0J89_14005 [Psychrobacter sp. SIMBA_152]